MAGLSQEAFAGVLESAWEHVQRVREETGVVIELRLTTVGLTALAVDLRCNRMATVSWRKLAQAQDMHELLLARISEVAQGQRRTHRLGPASLATAA
jgi:hypothetical protein